MEKYSIETCPHNTYKMEADHSADALWCSQCGGNLEIDEFPLSNELKSELSNWVLAYGKILEHADYGDHIKPETPMLVKSHDEKGISLYQKLKVELGDEYEVDYIHTSI